MPWSEGPAAKNFKRDIHAGAARRQFIQYVPGAISGLSRSLRRQDHLAAVFWNVGRQLSSAIRPLIAFIGVQFKFVLMN